MPVTDTDPRAAKVQLRLYQEAGPSRRATIAADLSDAIRETTLSGFRRRHPDRSPRELAELFLQSVYGFGRGR